jgi:hypothetical protein
VICPAPCANAVPASSPTTRMERTARRIEPPMARYPWTRRSPHENCLGLGHDRGPRQERNA